MKLKRMVACTLVLLLVVSILPIGALADTIPDNGPGVNREDIYPGDTMNKNMGDVGTNGGTIKQNVHVNDVPNSGIVRVNYGTIEENYGQVYENYETVENNEVSGSVGTNQDTGTIGTNNSTVTDNYGDIGTNNGMVVRNYGDIGTNNNSITTNEGTVGTNNDKVQWNYGTVETNGIDGVVYNYNNGGAAELSNDDEIEPPTEQPPVVAGVGTNFGTVYDYTNCVDENDQPTIYYGLSWGESVDKLNSIESFVLEGDPRNLDEIAKGIDRKGYKMKSYTAYSREEGKDVEIDNIADYEMNAPTWLEILWQKLGGKSEPKPAKIPVYTKLSGDQVKAGAFVSVNGCIFKIIEVNEDNIRVATVNQLPEKALTDMLGFLKQYLSDAQIAKFQSEPELLEEELVAKFFGGSNEHIAFYAARDLFA